MATSLARALLQTTPDPSSSSGTAPTETKARVLVINTGGTFGMVPEDSGKGDGGLVPKANVLVQSLRKQPIFHDEVYAQKTAMYERYGQNSLALPPKKTKGKADTRIIYSVLEYDPLLDSSNMTPSDWIKIGQDIEKNYEKYDGFVVLHGTDTMAYTASALSFLCENLGKPVVLTGSQVPIFELMNDGRDNLLGALLIAGQFAIPEVCLHFYNKLYRGNRVTKTDSESFNAFSSPNLSPLAVVEGDITVDWYTVWKPKTASKFRVSTTLNQDVGLLRLFPGITTATVEAFLQPPMKGVVLETYGMGNAPNNRPDLLDAVEAATKRGVIIVNCTQCLRGSVSPTYATGEELAKRGVIPGHDMTPEAALSKLSYVLAKEELDLVAKKKMMAEALRGELTPDLGGPKLCLTDRHFIRVITKFLSIGSKEELQAVCHALTPPLSCGAAKTGDIDALKALKDMGSDLSQGDCDGRTPLHVAASEGNLQVVQYLLSTGSSLHVKDRYGKSALSDAVRSRRKDIVELLRRAGAHLTEDQLEEAVPKLCGLAARGDTVGLEIWSLAGADLSKPGCDGRTAIEVAQSAGKSEVVTFIQELMKKKAQFHGEFGEFNDHDEYDDEGGVTTATPQ